jgi:hypothetical protein
MARSSALKWRERSKKSVIGFGCLAWLKGTVRCQLVVAIAARVEGRGAWLAVSLEPKQLFDALLCVIELALGGAREPYAFLEEAK